MIRISNIRIYEDISDEEIFNIVIKKFLLVCIQTEVSILKHISI